MKNFISKKTSTSIPLIQQNFNNEKRKTSKKTTTTLHRVQFLINQCRISILRPTTSTLLAHPAPPPATTAYDLNTFATDAPTGSGRIRFRMAAADGIVIGRAGDFPGQFLQGLPLRFRDQQGGQGAQEHEQGEDLHDVVEPRGGLGAFGARGGADGAKGAEDGLGDDGADFARGGGYAVRGGSIAGWETFARDDERGCVGT